MFDFLRKASDEGPAPLDGAGASPEKDAPACEGATAAVDAAPAADEAACPSGDVASGAAPAGGEPDVPSMVERTCREFSERLAAHEPIPGGGGASAYVGALGTALCTMVCHYTKGKPAYAVYDESIAHAIAATGRIRHELLELVDEDARAYECVTRAYGLSREDPGRPAAIEHALHKAAIPPYRIMVACSRSLIQLEELGDHVSKLLISDVACGALMCRAALQSASLTLYANTTAMADRECARELEDECDALLATWLPRADALAERAARLVRGRE